MDPDFLSVPVGGVITQAALQSDIETVRSHGRGGWQLVMSMPDHEMPAHSWLIGLEHATGRRERRRFQLAGEEDGQPVWRRVE